MHLAHRDDARLEPGLATTVGVTSRFALPAHPELAAQRIAPGHPDASVLLARVSSRDPFVQMPPLGTHLVDEEAVRLLSDWIVEIDASSSLVLPAPRTGETP
jgi:hypothetical protein